MHTAYRSSKAGGSGCPMRFQQVSGSTRLIHFQHYPTYIRELSGPAFPQNLAPWTICELLQSPTHPGLTWPHPAPLDLNLAWIHPLSKQQSQEIPKIPLQAKKFVATKWVRPKRSDKQPPTTSFLVVATTHKHKQLPIRVAQFRKY